MIRPEVGRWQSLLAYPGAFLFPLISPLRFLLPLQLRVIGQDWVVFLWRFVAVVWECPGLLDGVGWFCVGFSLVFQRKHAIPP